MKLPTVDYELRYREMYDRWTELKRILTTTNSKDVLTDVPNNTYFTCDQRWGWDDALNWIEMKMKELEEK